MKINEQQNQSILLSNFAEESLENVVQANVNLQEAHEYQKGGGHLYAYIFFAMAIVLWIWEWINTRHYYY
jgi:hypothetical protein